MGIDNLAPVVHDRPVDYPWTETELLRLQQAARAAEGLLPPPKVPLAKEQLARLEEELQEWLQQEFTA
jgi:hypothetical protein